MIPIYLDNCGNSRANTWLPAPTLVERALLLVQNQSDSRVRPLVTLDNFVPIAWPRAGDASFKCLPYQMTMVRDLPTMLATGSGESGFDSGEGA